MGKCKVWKVPVCHVLRQEGVLYVEAESMAAAKLAAKEHSKLAAPEWGKKFEQLFFSTPVELKNGKQ